MRFNKKESHPDDVFEKREDYFFIKLNGGITRIQCDDFLFAEAQGNYIKIVSPSNTTIANMTFAGFEGLLSRALLFVFIGLL